MLIATELLSRVASHQPPPPLPLEHRPCCGGLHTISDFAQNAFGRFFVFVFLPRAFYFVVRLRGPKFPRQDLSRESSSASPAVGCVRRYCVSTALSRIQPATPDFFSSRRGRFVPFLLRTLGARLNQPGRMYTKYIYTSFFLWLLNCFFPASLFLLPN